MKVDLAKVPHNEVKKADDKETVQLIGIIGRSSPDESAGRGSPNETLTRDFL